MAAERADHNRADAGPRPSLTRSSGDRPSGLFPLIAWWLVRLLEPIGYVAATAIGVGLWVLLRGYLTGLSDVVTLTLLVVSAGALWWAAWAVGRYPFAETWRLGNAIFAAAIGTTGWIAWVGTEGVLERGARFTLTAGLITVFSYVVQRFRGDLVTWNLFIVALFATALGAGITLGDGVDERAAGYAAIGTLVAAAVAYLVAGRAVTARYQSTTFVVLSITVLALLTGFGMSTGLALGVAVAGLVAAVAAYLAVRPPTRTGKVSAVTDATLAFLVALVRIDVPLPIVLIVGGSVVLAVLGWAAKKVIGSSTSVPEDGTSTAPDVAAASALQDPSGPDTSSQELVAETPPAPGPVAADPAPQDPSGVATTPSPQVTTTADTSTNGLAIASLILGITWIFWVGSLFAVILGHIALSQIDYSDRTQSGRPIAVAGLVLGYIGLGVLALTGVVVFLA